MEKLIKNVALTALAFVPYLALTSCGTVNSPKILAVKLERAKTEYWCKMTICLDKIPEDNINGMGASFYYKSVFITKSNRRFLSEGFFVGQKIGECVEINCSSLHKRGMLKEEFIFYKDQILLDSIASLQIELFKQKSNFNWTPISSQTVTKFDAN